MNKLFTVSVLALFLGSATLQAQDWAQMSYFKAQNDSIRAVSDEVNVVFMGNSITQGWLSMRREFFQKHGFVNRGIGGQTTPQMLLRFRQDVIDLNPRIVVILAGINDIAENTGPISLTEIADNIESMVQLAQANGVVPVICSVLPANSFPWRQRIDPTEKVIELNGLLQQIAYTYKLPYVDYYSAMVDPEKGLKSDWGYDPVHPNEAGYAVMEPILLSILNNLY
jgi:lysophospholipase L1-like esterase